MRKTSGIKHNPAIAIACFWIVLVAAACFFAEKILAGKYHAYYYPTRFVRLREYRPYYQEFPLQSALETYKAGRPFNKEFHFRVDGDGFIMPSAVFPNPDVKILFLGGSTTECFWVDEENRFPYLTGQLLSKSSGRMVNAYNGGVQGNNLIHVLDLLLNKGVPLHPQIIVWMEDINDMATLLYLGGYWNDNFSRSPVVTLGFKASVHYAIADLINWIAPNLRTGLHHLSQQMAKGADSKNVPDEFKAARGRQVHYDKQRMRNEFRMNIQTLIDLCKVRGFKPILMTQANQFTVHPEPQIIAPLEGVPESISYSNFRDLYESFNQEIRDVGRKNGVAVIDLEREIPPKPELFFDAVHLSDAGSQMAAHIIARALAGSITRDSSSPRKPD